MSEPFTYPEKPIDRGKRADDRDSCRRLGEWGRYKDVDGDGIPYRTMPGDGMPAYFCRGFGPQRDGPVQRAAGGLRRQHRPAGAQVRDGAHARAAAGRRDRADGARIGIIGYGTSHWGDRREPRPAPRRRRASRRRTSGCAPIRSRRRCRTFIDAHDRVYVVEQNRDGQMLGLLKLRLDAGAADQAAQRACTTTACRSTRAPSPTRFCAGRSASLTDERIASQTRRPVPRRR